jgi:hypothetical protein
MDGRTPDREPGAAQPERQNDKGKNENDRHCCIMACVLAGSFTSLPAQAPGRGGAGQQPAAGIGEIRGTVLDAEGKTPIASAS